MSWIPFWLACASPVAPTHEPTCEGVAELDVAYQSDTTVVDVRVATLEEQVVEIVGVEVDGDHYLDLPPASRGLDHSMPLLGLPADRDVTVDVQVGACLETVEFHSGAPDTVFPYVTDPDEQGHLGDGWFVVSTIIDGGGYASILATDGTPVWWTQVQFAPFRTLLDGDAVLYNTQATAPWAPGEIVRHPLHGDAIERVAVQGAHTDFVLKPDGTLATLVWLVDEVDGRELVASGIVEVTPDGAETLVWSAFDALEPDLDRDYPAFASADPGAAQLEEWLHVNSLSWSEERQAYLVTTGSLHTPELDRLFRVEADGTTSAVVGPEPLASPHSARFLDDGTVLVFNRGAEGEACAYVQTLAIDGDDATEVDRVVADGCARNLFLGEAQALDGDGTFINYSSAGVMQVLDADDRVALQIQTDLGAAFGYGEYRTSLYR